MEEEPWLKYWVKRLEEDDQYGNIRLKILEGYDSKLGMEIYLLDIVDKTEFVLIESDRLPLFIGSQFGISPRMEDIPNFFNGEKVIAILGKSMLSGVVAGLGLYQIDKNDREFTHKKIKYFENKL